MRRRRRPDLPALNGGERLLAVGESTDGAVHATSWGLRLPGLTDADPVLGWHEIERAGWNTETEQLVVVETADAGSRARTHRIQLVNPAALVDVVREQVTGSVVLTRYELVSGEHGVRVTARRRPADGEIVWTATLDPELDLGDPEVRSAAETVVATVRAELLG